MNIDIDDACQTPSALQVVLIVTGPRNMHTFTSKI